MTPERLGRDTIRRELLLDLLGLIAACQPHTDEGDTLQRAAYYLEDDPVATVEHASALADMPYHSFRRHF